MIKEDLTIALLIDTENIESRHMEIVQQRLIALGRITYKRIYGDFSAESKSDKSKKWRDIVNNFALQPMQHYPFTTNKGSCDTRIIIDAMDIMHSGNVNAICIMSSDSDYTGLAKRLKEENIYVIGAGESNTPDSFVTACDEFILVEAKGKKDSKKEQPKETAEKSKKKKQPPVKEAEGKKPSGKGKDAIKTVSIVAKEEIYGFAEVMLSQNGTDSYSLEKLFNKIKQRYPQFELKQYGVKKSYDFFDEKTFKVTRENDTNWVISLK